MSFIEKIQRLKNRKGFTLVELMCAIGIFTFMIATVFALMNPLNEISKVIKGDSEAATLSLTVEGYIARQLQMCNCMELYWMDEGDWQFVSDRVENFGNLGHITGVAPSPPYNNNDPDFHKHTGVNDNPHALVIKRDDDMMYVYNINIKSLTSTQVAAILASLSSSPPDYTELEKYRVFNRSYYDKIGLDFAAWIDGNLFNTTITAKRYDPKTDSYEDSHTPRRESVTTMFNIDKTNPVTGFTYEATTDDKGYVTPDGFWRGDYLILYNNVSAVSGP